MPSTATWMNLETVILTEVSQIKKEKYILHMRSPKRNDTDELIYKTETHRLWEGTYACSGLGGKDVKKG